jgi:succinate dehydrogenase/fumarate reductase flavoprotein subunit
VNDVPSPDIGGMVAWLAKYVLTAGIGGLLVRLYTVRQSAKKVPSEVGINEANAVNILAGAGKVRAEGDAINVNTIQQAAQLIMSQAIDIARLERELEHAKAQVAAAEGQLGLKVKGNGKG